MNPLPRPFSRQTVLNACSILQTIGHSPFTRFLLEVGLEGKVAGRECGGLLDRSTALGKHAIENPDALTPEEEPLSLAIVRRAALADHSYPEGGLHGLSDRERRSFWDSLQRDGYSFDGEEIGFSGRGKAPAKKSPSPTTNHSPSSTATVLFPEKATMPAPMSNKIFLVHGRDESARESVENYLRKLKLEPIVLHDRPSRGRTLITKFTEEAEGSCFAVVLITPDDEGRSKGTSDLSNRGRQNVIFELGFFVGKLGAGNVCALLRDSVEKPSDIDGIVYVPFGPTTNWKNELARELRAAGVPYDRDAVY